MGVFPEGYRAAMHQPCRHGYPPPLCPYCLGDLAGDAADVIVEERRRLDQIGSVVDVALHNQHDPTLNLIHRTALLERALRDIRAILEGDG